MPLKHEDITKALDLKPEDFEDVKGFVDHFGKEWKRTKDVPDVDAAKGKWNNVLRGQLKKLNKEYELDLEIKDKDGDKDVDPVDYLPEITKRLSGKSAVQIAELNEKLTSNAPEKVVKEWSEKYGKLEQKNKDQEALLSGLKGQYEGLQKSVDTDKAKAWEDNQWENAVSKVKWKQGISDYEKKGFLSEQRAKYRAQKDEKGEAYASDADGNRIPDPAKPAKFKGLDEILIDNVKSAKLYEVHEKGGQRVNNVVLRTEEGGGAAMPTQKPAHRLHPSMVPSQR